MITIIGMTLILLGLLSVFCAIPIDYFIEKYTKKITNKYSEFIKAMSIIVILFGALLSLFGILILFITGENIDNNVKNNLY